MKASSISFGLLVGLIAIAIGFYLSFGSMISKQVNADRYIAIDFYRYQTFLYYSFVEVPYIFRFEFFDYTINHFGNYNYILNQNPDNTYDICSNNIIYNPQISNNYITFKPCIAMYSIENPQYNNPEVLYYIYENSEKYLKNISYFDSYNYNLNTFSIYVKYSYYDIFNNSFRRYFNIEIPYNISEDMYIYDQAVFDMYSDTYYIFNKTLLNANKNLYELNYTIKNSNLNIINNDFVIFYDNLTFPIVFYIYDPNMSSNTLYYHFDIPIPCEYLGGSISDGKCNIQYNSLGQPLIYECLYPNNGEKILYNLNNIKILKNISNLIIYNLSKYYISPDNNLLTLPDFYQTTNYLIINYLINNNVLDTKIQLIPLIYKINFTEIKCEIFYIEKNISYSSLQECNDVADKLKKNPFLYYDPTCVPATSGNDQSSTNKFILKYGERSIYRKVIGYKEYYYIIYSPLLDII